MFVAKHVSVIRRVKKSEAIDGTQVRLAAIASEQGDPVRWKLGSIEVNQQGKVRWFRRHASVESVSHVDGKSSEWQEYSRNEILMSAGWNAVAMEPNAYHKAEDLNNDDDASMYGHSDSFMVELRIDVFQDVKAMKEHKGDI